MSQELAKLAWIPFIPAVDVAPFAAMEVTGTTTIRGRLTLSTQKFTAASPPRLVVVNGPYAVAAADAGVCSMAAERPVAALTDATAGQMCGPAVGSWSLTAGAPGFLCVGTGPAANTGWVIRLPAADVYWFIADATGWVANGGDNYVKGKLCDRDGSNERTMTAVNIYLPRIDDCDPVVFEDQVIGARVADDGVLVCVTAYTDGSKIGDYRMVQAAGNIRPGWRECDGGATEDFSGLFPKARNAGGDIDEDDAGDTGGVSGTGAVNVFDNVAAGTNVTNLDNTDFETATVREANVAAGNEDDTRPPWKVVIMIERFE